MYFIELTDDVNNNKILINISHIERIVEKENHTSAICFADSSKIIVKESYENVNVILSNRDFTEVDIMRARL